ncbi:LysR substrate-binding domain-containing protein [Bradyrhizobium sp. SBR1B]|uniref:LysR substrate-binding domain-containing protein n=1 Tax=Bradyrhizobium sp. SBR1B TaxID=2663836 RepID=UPI001793CC0B|nr:LysR substrate-binding domain-containing protein [Bradyrhizobium sp. SBR1B]MBB4381092.1 DNA-binding transcriptional LysR family regulator [Bradyrhizobium sp. SBR1B]
MTVSPAFAVKWLLPRIHRFQAKSPDMDVRLDTNLKLSDFVAQGIDIGVRYGTGDWPGLLAEKLMEEEVYPVCSPSLAKGFGSPRELLAEMLIHDLSVDRHAGFITWDQWLAKVGAADVSASRRGLHINNSAAVLQAAMEGQGVALARSIMARDDLASGRLVRLFPEITLPSSLSYYVVHRAESAGLPRLASFRDWLFTEAAANAADEQTL